MLDCGKDGWKKVSRILHIFFRLEKQQLKKNLIGKLIIDGSLCEDQKGIANFCAKYYNDLYTSKFNKQHALEFFYHYLI